MSPGLSHKVIGTLFLFPIQEEMQVQSFIARTVSFFHHLDTKFDELSFGFVSRLLVKNDNNTCAWHQEIVVQIEATKPLSDITFCYRWVAISEYSINSYWNMQLSPKNIF